MFSTYYIDLWLVLYFQDHKLSFLKILLNIPVTLDFHLNCRKAPIENENWGLRKLQNSHYQCHLNPALHRKMGREAAESVFLTCNHCPVELKELVLKFLSARLVLHDCNSWELWKHLRHCMTILFRHWFQFTREAFILKTCPNSSDQ